jgi:hypothetical protein
MDPNKIPKSPVLPANQQWSMAKRKGGYESDVTALVRSMLEDDAIREDQRAAWERWRNDPANLK